MNLTNDDNIEIEAIFTKLRSLKRAYDIDSDILYSKMRKILFIPEDSCRINSFQLK